ncbi:zinc transporter 5-like isoform X2 [Camellia sinensis]|uniref:Uncharacterized protein n=1 Tax=Camellia sinensis var. sinensis TaxID=542762 RepID=A0A4S4DSN2_CAMSN|nr:zinc transporter 5-like isoform X2 [Camellia sinensis]THG06242.1 hypothetical protein TEA_025831 [Camellia sinensis var. sinensis]
MNKLQPYAYKTLTLLLYLHLLFPPISVHAKCTCEAEYKDQNKQEALKYKLVSIASILVASALGVSMPLLLKNVSALKPHSALHFLIKAFAAGVILATGFIHILPDAFNSLTSPCLSENPWQGFPFAGFIAMMSAIGTLMMEAFATGYHKRAELRKAQPVNGDEESDGGGGPGHVHGPAAIMLQRSDSSDLFRNRVISQAKYKSRAITIMVLFFSLTTPAGIAIGIGISNIYNEYSPTSLIVEGVLNSASAGILIYMALVDLLAADFMNPNLQTNVRLQLGSNLALLLGASCMSLMAEWGGA